jgi:hypothetical protein
MANLGKRALTDLSILGGQRATEAVHSVTQLMDNDREQYAVMITAAAHIAGLAAQCMQSGVHRQTGDEPDFNVCVARVLVHLAECLGMQATAVDESEFKRRKRSCKTSD